MHTDPIDWKFIVRQEESCVTGGNSSCIESPLLTELERHSDCLSSDKIVP